MDKGTLSVGFGKADITPPLGCALAGSFSERRATKVNRPLEALALVVSSGGKGLAFVVLDLILLEPGDVARIKAEVSSQLGFAPDEIIISCTHTHTGPSPFDLHRVPKEVAYIASLPPKVVAALSQAEGNMTPARFRGAWGGVYGVSFNRRYLLTDGTVRMNAAARGDLRPIRHMGPVDPELSVLYFEDMRQNPLGLFAAFALHYVGGQDPYGIDPDYFRDFRDVVAEQMGEGCQGMLANGASGDINNCDILHVGDYKPNMRGVAEKLALEAVRVAREWHYQPESLEIRSATRSFTVAKRMPTDQMLSDARKLLAEATEDTPADKLVYAASYVQIAESSERERTIELIGARIGDVAILGLPSEVFAEIGMAIKARSPFPMLHLLGNTNGWNGYIPAKRCFAEGSYETELSTASFCAEDTGDRMIEEATRLLESLKG